MSTTTYISEFNGQKLCAERAAYTVEGKDIDESLEDLASNTSALIAGSNVNITSSASGITVSVPDGSTSTKGALQLAGSIGATVSTENGKAASEKAVRDAIDGIGNTLEIVTTSSTSSDITNLIAAGKIPVLRNATSGSAYYSQLSTINAGAIVFSRTIDDNSISYQRVLPSGTWQSGLVTLEKTENKVTTIRAAASATDTDYPSEKAVRTTIDSLKLTDLGGTLTVAKGGTGATTAAGAMRALTEDKIGTGTQYFITITENWARSGYCSVADAKTVLGLGSAAYQNTGAFAPATHTHTTSEITDFGSYVTHRGNAGKSNMNDVGKLYPSVGMTSLSDPGNTVDNPLTGTDKSTSWHLYWDASYSDNPSGSNAWVAQICNKAGTAQWWVRSRSGGSITNGTAWAAGWDHLVVASQAGLGNSTTPVYVDKYGRAQLCNAYPTSLPASDVYSWAKASSKPSYTASEVGAAPSSGSNYYVTNSNSSDVGSVDNYSVNTLAANGSTVAMVNNATDNPCGAKKWIHVLSLAWKKGTSSSWVSQMAMGSEAGDGMWYRTTSSNVSGLAWKRVMDSSNCSVALNGSTLTVKINGVSKSLTNTNTTYSAGAGIGLSGTEFNNQGIRDCYWDSDNDTLYVNKAGRGTNFTLGYASRAGRIDNWRIYTAKQPCAALVTTTATSSGMSYWCARIVILETGVSHQVIDLICGSRGNNLLFTAGKLHSAGSWTTKLYAVKNADYKYTFYIEVQNMTASYISYHITQYQSYGTVALLGSTSTSFSGSATSTITIT